ncbi:MAG: AAA family ATPase [Planctomycetes bacterium]|nr:AAA family ATPase [Planctomycetota bacterium]
MDWIHEGYLAVGSVTLLVGLWKAGKTTFLAHLLAATDGGGVVGPPVSMADVIVVTEEGDKLWAARRDEIGIRDNVRFITRPFKGRPRQREWERLVDRIAAEVRNGNTALVVFDTWQSMSPSEDENDAAKMMAALTPLHRITEAGSAVLLIHHPRKGDGQEGTASRGTGALPGFVDIIVELRRFDRERPDDTRRVLRGLSRFDETPAEVVIELREDGYHTVGSKADASRRDRMETISAILADADDPVTVEGVREVWPEGGVPKPGKRTLAGDLATGHVDGRWGRDGKGARGSPFRYFDSRKPPPLEARNGIGPEVEEGLLDNETSIK